MKKLAEYFIKSLNEYNDILSELESKRYYEIFFRGQTDDYPLIPSIGRSSLVQKEDEVQLFDEFKRLNKLYREINTTDEWDLLAIAQHYGLKTRLLDWSTNPLNALWFACNTYSSINYKDNYCVVWILANKEKDVDFIVDQKKTPFFENTHTLIFKPNYQAIRIRSQQGLFTVHKETKNKSEKTNSYYLALEDDDKFINNDKWDIIKILINRPKFSKEIIAKLNTFGINEATIYPELEGLCRHLNWFLLR